MSNKKQTADSFGEKWLSEAGRNYGRKEDVMEQFLSILGVKKEGDLKEIFKDGMVCLDAGCGVGVAEEILNINKNVKMYAIDISDSVRVAEERTRDMENVQVLKADIKDMPFKRKQLFDIIFSNGVLHHTGDAEGYFSELCHHLKPCGLIGIYIYNKKPLVRSLADNLIRNEHTTHLSFEECFEFAETLSMLGRSFQKIKENLIIEEDVPLLGIKKGKYNLHTFIYDHFLKCFYNEKWGLDMSTVVNVDWYHPSEATFHTLPEILLWFRSNDIVNNIRVLQPTGWEHSGWFVSGRKEAFNSTTAHQRDWFTSWSLPEAK